MAICADKFKLVYDADQCQFKYYELGAGDVVIRNLWNMPVVRETQIVWTDSIYPGKAADQFLLMWGTGHNRTTGSITYSSTGLVVATVSGGVETTESIATAADMLTWLEDARRGCDSGLNSNYRLLSQFLSTNGDGTGTVSATGDYSGAPQNFELIAGAFDPNVRKVEIERLIVFVRDGGSFDANFYGNNITIPNGITIEYELAGPEIIDLTAGQAINSNVEWGQFCYDVTNQSFGSGDDSLLVRWTFAKFGRPIFLNPGEIFRVTLNDDFSNLVDHTFLLEGVRWY